MQDNDLIESILAELRKRGFRIIPPDPENQ
jgi:hypothetical protein